MSLLAMELLLLLSFTVMLSWYPCAACCAGEPAADYDCSLCSGVTPNTVSIIISGTSDGSVCTGCAAQWDGTWIALDTSGPFTSCVWLYNVPKVSPTCADPLINFQPSVTFGGAYLSGSNVGWVAMLQISQGQADGLVSVYFSWDSGGTGNIDCLTTRSLTYKAGAGVESCDLSTASVSLNPNG